MKQFVHMCAAAVCSFSMLSVSAQLNPTISGDDMLCPQGTGTLTTQQFDSYQWYRRYYGSVNTDPIPGETNQTLTMDYNNYAASYLSVVVTAGAQTDTSAEYFVDGWAFAGMTVMSDGNFTIGPNGESIICPGESMSFEVMMPYNTNIQWFESGNPIPGANGTTLTVTQPGTYAVEGAPAVCPNYIVTPGVELIVDQWIFNGMTVMSDGEFTVGPNGESVICQGDTMYFEVLSPYDTNIQWYESSQPIAGANAITLAVTEAGTYSVEGAPAICPNYSSNPGVDLIVLVENCSGAGISEPNLEAAEVFPVPAHDVLNVVHPSTLIREITVTNHLGQRMYESKPNAFNSQVSTESFQSGYYFITIRYAEGEEIRSFIVE